jgi:DNA processing protein
VWPETGPSRSRVGDVALPGAWPEGFVGGPADRDALLVLSFLETLTPSRLHRLAWQEGTAERCLAEVRGGRVTSEGDRAIASAVDSVSVRHTLEALRARQVIPGDDEYPAALLDLPDPPACLFLRGQRTVDRPPAVAVVGARSCSPYGREVSRGFGAGLAAAGVEVVSGAARGIDAEAHMGALAVKGRTAAVLGSGIDVAYPRGHEDLINRIAAQGTVISEYPPGVKAHPRRFPARNRIVAALARGVVVVEGAEGSGSLITAEFCQDLQRDVMAVPGPVIGPLSAAPNELIRDGATLVTSPSDVLSVLGMSFPRAGRSSARPPEPPSGTPVATTEDEQRVLAVLPGSPVTLESLVDATGVGLEAALRALAGLELKGLVRAEGGRFRRAPG